MKYFAYGSNLHPVRLRQRVQAFTVHGVARLDAHVLAFSKRGRDGSGKCTVLPVAQSARAVWGVLYEIDPRFRGVLDEAEGLGAGYEAVPVAVTVGPVVHEAFTYRAQPGFVDPELNPFDWYKALVVEGARRHGLDPRHVAWLESVAATRDPDTGRAERHWAIVREPT